MLVNAVERPNAEATVMMIFQSIEACARSRVITCAPVHFTGFASVVLHDDDSNGEGREGGDCRFKRSNQRYTNQLGTQAGRKDVRKGLEKNKRAQTYPRGEEGKEKELELESGREHDHRGRCEHGDVETVEARRGRGLVMRFRTRARQFSAPPSSVSASAHPPPPRSG